MNKEYHKECFRCMECGMEMNGDRRVSYIGSSGGKILCNACTKTTSSVPASQNESIYFTHGSN